MNLKESISFKHTAAPKKQRKVLGYWNWPDLITLAKRAIETGQEQAGAIQGGQYYAIATPDYGIVESRRTAEYVALHEKVRIFSAFRLNHVRTSSLRLSQNQCPRRHVESPLAR